MSEIESDDDVRQIGFQTPMGYTHKHCRRETMIDDDERLRPRWVSKQREREDFKNKANRNRLGSVRFGSVRFGSARFGSVRFVLPFVGTNQSE